MEYKYKLGDIVAAFGKQFKIEGFSEMGYPIWRTFILCLSTS